MAFQLAGNWTYEKAWAEPETIKIRYEGKRESEESGPQVQEYVTTQWSEVYTEYKTFAYIDRSNNQPQIQDLVIQRIRIQYTTSAALCGNFYKWLLEAPLREETNGSFQEPGSTEVTRTETTEIKYAKSTKDGSYVPDTETTTTLISGWEYLGSQPVKDFRPWHNSSLDDYSEPFYFGPLRKDLEKEYVASVVEKQYFATDWERDAPGWYIGNAKEKRTYTRQTTKVQTMYALTQEGQQYVQKIYEDEPKNRTEPLYPNSRYTQTQEAWKEGARLTTDGLSVNTSIGRWTLEEKPNDYDEAEEELDDESTDDDDADTADGSGSGGDEGAGATPPEESGTSDTSADSVGEDLVSLWDKWSPYEGSVGNQFPGTPNKEWSGDPLNEASNPKPEYRVTIKKRNKAPENRGEIWVDSDKPTKVKQISISDVSYDNYWTNKMTVGQKVLINSPSGLCTYWYLIREVLDEEGRVAKVRFIENIVTPAWLQTTCRYLGEGWLVNALVTSVKDSSTRVFQMPYAPDDYMVCRDGSFRLVPGDARRAANSYLAVQKRLAEGQDSGINITTSLKELPSKPFADVYLNMLGVSVYGRTNGTTWAFNDSGCVVSTDIIYGGHAGQDGSSEGREARAAVVRQQSQCPIEQSEGWINPPDGLKIADLPVITSEIADPATVQKADSVEVEDDFDPTDPDCGLWTDLLPCAVNEDVLAETVETDHVFVKQTRPILVGAVRARAKFKEYPIGVDPDPTPEHIFLTVTTKASSDAVDTDQKPEPTITRTRTWAKVSGFGTGDGSSGPKPPVFDCKLLVKPGFGMSSNYPSGMYLGLSDGGNRVNYNSSTSGADWDKIKNEPTFWEWAQLWKDDYGQTQNRSEAIQLISPVQIQGEDYGYIWIDSGSQVYFTKTGDQSEKVWAEGFGNEPGTYAAPVLSIASSFANKLCGFIGVRTTRTTQTFRYQGGSFFGQRELNGEASVIWELTFYKRNAAIDADNQFCDLKISKFDYAADTYLNSGIDEATTDWWNKVVLALPGKTRLLEAGIPLIKNEGQEGITGPTSWVVLSNLQGFNWTQQVNHYVESPCDYYTQGATVGHVHSAVGVSALQRTEVKHVHAVGKGASVAMSVFTDYVEDRPRDSQISPSKLKGIYPSWFLADVDDNWGKRFNSVVGCGMPWYKPWPTNELPDTGQLAFNDIAEREGEYGFFTGGSSDPLIPNIEIGFETLGDGSFPEFLVEERTIFVVLSGTEPKTTLENCDQVNKLGAPLRISTGRFHSVLGFGSLRDPEINLNYLQINTGSLNGTDLIYAFPAPEKEDETTGSYLFNYNSKTEGLPQVLPRNEPCLYANPIKHGQSKKPTWGLIGYHPLNDGFAQTNSIKVVYFADSFAKPYQVKPDSLVPTAEYPALAYMQSPLLPTSNARGDSNVHSGAAGETDIVYVDTENIYIRTEHYGVGSEPADTLSILKPTGTFQQNPIEAGWSATLFFDEPDYCVSRIIGVQNYEVMEEVSIDVGWKPQVVWFWMFGEEQGFNRNEYKRICYRPEDGDDMDFQVLGAFGQGKFRTTSLGDNGEIGWLNNLNNFEIKFTDTGVTFRRYRAWDDETVTDNKIFACLQREKQAPNSQVGQFFLNGLEQPEAGLNYSGNKGYKRQYTVTSTKTWAEAGEYTDASAVTFTNSWAKVDL